MQDWIEIMAAQIQAQTAIDWLILVTSLLYVALAARGNSWCWFFGIISCSLWGWVSLQANLYADAGLQLFYVVVSFYGIYQWQKDGNQSNDISINITELPLINHLIIMLLGLAGGAIAGCFLKEYTSAVATYMDATTTVFAMVATFLTAKKILSNWLYWIVVDAAYIYLYSSRGLVMLTFIMGIYVVLAGYGYWKWRREA